MSSWPVSTYVGFIKQLKADLHNLKAQKAFKEDAIEAHWNVINNQLAEKHDIEVGFLTHGSWDCEDSETGACYFNDEEDPCNDFCLVCGNPEERK